MIRKIYNFNSMQRKLMVKSNLFQNVKKIILPLIILLFTNGLLSAREIKITYDEAQAFFKGKKAKMVYMYCDCGRDREGYIYYIDFSENPLTEKLICKESAIEQMIYTSPTGTHFVYAIYDSATQKRNIYIRPIKENCPDSEKILVAKDAHYPTWWYHTKTKKHYILYLATASTNSSIYIQELSSTFTPTGQPNVMLDNPGPNGGRSPDGGFMANEDENAILGTVNVKIDTMRSLIRGHGAYTVSPSEAISNVKITSWVNFVPSTPTSTEAWGGFCNGHITPVADPTHPLYGSIMYLGSSHHDIYVRKIMDCGNSYNIADRNMNYPLFWCNSDAGILHHFYIAERWQFPAWSWHPNYLAACGSIHKGTVKWQWGFLIRFGTPEDSASGTRKLIFENGCFTPHLWVENNLVGTSSIKSTPSSTVKTLKSKSFTIHWNNKSNAVQTLTINGRTWVRPKDTWLPQIQNMPK